MRAVREARFILFATRHFLRFHYDIIQNFCNTETSIAEDRGTSYKIWFTLPPSSWSEDTGATAKTWVSYKIQLVPLSPPPSLQFFFFTLLLNSATFPSIWLEIVEGTTKTSG
jgi:hypothetical protein